MVLPNNPRGFKNQTPYALAFELEAVVRVEMECQPNELTGCSMSNRILMLYV